MTASVDLPADAATVYGVLTSAAWPGVLDAQLHDGSTLLQADPTPDGGLQLRTSRRLPEGVPGFLQRFTPPDGTVVQTDTWQAPLGDARAGSWSVTFPGSPAVLEGRTTVEPAAGGCRWTVSGTVTVRVPLLGGRIEGFVAPLLEKLVLRQGEVLRTQLPG